MIPGALRFVTRMRAGAVAAMVGLLLVAFSFRVAAADGLFYVEERKDSRILVFSRPASFQEWQSTGEIPKGIVREKAGPAGETVVFDSTDAINLYNFKHDKPGEVFPRDEGKRGVSKFEWKDGKTTFESETGAFSLETELQARWKFDETKENGEQSAFSLRRAKTKFEGWIYNKQLTYLLKVDWFGEEHLVADATLNYDFTGNGAVQIKTGRFKVPYGRQELISFTRQQFCDRTDVTEEFTMGRDYGLQIWGLAWGDRFEWRAGVFNGTGEDATKSTNNYEYAGRIMFQPWGDVGYSESDLENLDHPRFAVALAGSKNEFREGISRDSVEGDVSFKYSGVSLYGEFFHRRNLPRELAETTSTGLISQIGVFLLPGKFELAFRYARIDPSDLERQDEQIEKGVAANWYFHKHALKLQGDYRQIDDRASGSKTKEARLQLQYFF